MIINDSNYMFTLQDAVGLANIAKVNTDKNKQYIEAIKGNYILPTNEIAGNEARMKSGKHLADGGSNDTGIIGLPAGKLPGHPTFSTESPYSIDGFKSAQGGVWLKSDNGWDYTPSQNQLNTPGYIEGLAEYAKNKRSGIDTLTLPEKVSR